MLERPAYFDPVWHRACLSYLYAEKKMNSLKIDTFFLALLLVPSALWARIAIQGFEPALVSTAMGWILNVSKRVRARL